MKVAIWRERSKAELPTSLKEYPTITVTEEELRDQSIPATVAQIDIVQKDGKIGRFWVSVATKNGRPVIATSCNSIKNSKKLTGSFK